MDPVFALTLSGGVEKIGAYAGLAAIPGLAILALLYFSQARELRRLRDGVTDDEIDRVKAGLKSSLIMQEESTSARAGAIATDWYYLGRVRSFDEVQAAIDGLTPAGVVGYVERFPARALTLVTLGPKPLTMPS